MSGELATHPAACEAHEVFFLHLVDFPEFPVRDIGNPTLPEQIVHQVVTPRWGEVFVEHIAHLVAEPSLGVDSVGDGFDGLSVSFEVWEKMAPHVIANLAVELTDGIIVARQFDGEDGHAELLVVAARRGKPEVNKLVRSDSSLDTVIIKILSNQSDIKRFVTGRYRRVRCED